MTHRIATYDLLALDGHGRERLGQRRVSKGYCDAPGWLLVSIEQTIELPHEDDDPREDGGEYRFPNAVNAHPSFRFVQTTNEGDRGAASGGLGDLCGVLWISTRSVLERG